MVKNETKDTIPKAIDGPKVKSNGFCSSSLFCGGGSIIIFSTSIVSVILGALEKKFSSFINSILINQ